MEYLVFLFLFYPFKIPEQINVVLHVYFSLDVVQLDLQVLGLLVLVDLAQMTMVVMRIIQQRLDLPLLARLQHILFHQGPPLIDTVDHCLGERDQLLDLLQVLGGAVDLLALQVLDVAVLVHLLDVEEGLVERGLLALAGVSAQLLIDHALDVRHDVGESLLVLHLVVEELVVLFLCRLGLDVGPEVPLEDFLDEVEVEVT